MLPRIHPDRMQIAFDDHCAPASSLFYWNRAWPVRLPLPISPCVNARAHRFGGFGLMHLSRRRTCRRLAPQFPFPGPGVRDQFAKSSSIRSSNSFTPSSPTLLRSCSWSPSAISVGVPSLSSMIRPVSIALGSELVTIAVSWCSTSLSARGAQRARPVSERRHSLLGTAASMSGSEWRTRISLRIGIPWGRAHMLVALRFHTGCGRRHKNAPTKKRFELGSGFDKRQDAGRVLDDDSVDLLF